MSRIKRLNEANHPSLDRRKTCANLAAGGEYVVPCDSNISGPLTSGGFPCFSVGVFTLTSEPAGAPSLGHKMNSRAVNLRHIAGSFLDNIHYQIAMKNSDLLL